MAVQYEYIAIYIHTFVLSLLQYNLPFLLLWCARLDLYNHTYMYMYMSLLEVTRELSVEEDLLFISAHMPNLFYK